MKDIICCKCNYVLDLDEWPDTGECPKCGGTMYEEGVAFTDTTVFEFFEFVKSLPGFLNKKKPKLKN